MNINISEEESLILTRKFVDRYKDLTINYVKFLNEIYKILQNVNKVED